MKKHLPVFYFVFLSGVASFFNYAIYPVLSRVLGDDEFVKITVALALFTQLSSFMLSIVALTIGLSKETSSDKSKAAIEKLQAVLTHLFIVLIVLILITSPFFLGTLRLPASMLFPICLMLALSISISIISGYLNGKQKLVKLGFAIALSSFMQFAFIVGFGITTKSGVIALNAMAFGTLITIVILYRIYRDEELPRLSSVFIHKLELYRSKEMRGLIIYTILASLATLITSILMVIDLLIINNRAEDAKIYTDIYIVSRIVFFGGMLFVWPFLSKIKLQQTRTNNFLLLRLVAIYSIITLGAISIILIFGQRVTEVLLGSNYTHAIDIKSLAIFAIIYKFIFLILLTLILYFIAIRSYWAIYLPVLLACAVGLTVIIKGEATTSLNLVSSLSAVSAICTFIGLWVYWSSNRSNIRS